MQNKQTQIPTSQPRKRLSPWRLMLAILVIAGLAKGTSWSWSKIKEERALSTFKPWFASYVDVTATPYFAFEQPTDLANGKNSVLAFIVAAKNDACTPTWGGYYTLDEANKELDLDRRIARYRQLDGNIAVSFGGLLNDELAVNCKDHELLQKAYEEVITHYAIDTLDFDLEGEGLKDTDALKRRAQVIATLQNNYRKAGKNLAVWLTLPVAPQGLTPDGTNAIAIMLDGGVDLAGVNVMTMDYGESRPKTQSMQEAAISALTQTHRQIGILFAQAGINLSPTTLWSKMGATPMIGQNDIVDEIFTLDDAVGLNDFLLAKGVARVSMWSSNRDIQCGDNYVNLSVVSTSCSGVKQEDGAFSAKIGQGFDGKIADNSGETTVTEPLSEQVADNPAESPYQIWTDKGVYLAGTKVVWHQNVYQAKWWTSGDSAGQPGTPVVRNTVATHWAGITRRKTDPTTDIASRNLP